MTPSLTAGGRRHVARARASWLVAAVLVALALASWRPAMWHSPAVGAEPWVWQPKPGEIELFVGNIDMGKSEAARVRTLRIRRLLTWDPVDDELNPGSGRVTIGQAELALAHHPELLLRGTVRLAVRPTAWSSEGVRAEFERFCKLAWRIGGLCVKVEETGRLVRHGYYPDAFDKVLAEGRHRGLSVVLVGQRFSMVPVLARTNATRLVVFKHGYDDADEVAKRLSLYSALVEPAQVTALERFHFIEWTPTEGARFRAPLGHTRSTT